MAITREKREELVATYDEVLTQSDGFVVLEYKQLTVARTQDLRRKMRASSGQYMVTKNTLFKHSLEKNGWPIPESLLKGSTAVAFGKGNFPGIAKEVLNFVKDLPELLVVKGGVMGTTILSANDVEAVSNLPTIDELRAQLAGLIVQPASGLVGVIQAATSDIVNVLQAYLNDREGAA